jgi:Ca-activated chloride channel family protein
MMTLLDIKPKSARAEMLPDGGYRHLLIALDVSPSMQLKDAGPEKIQSRASRAGEVMMSLLQRIAIEQVRISIVGFYTDAKPVAIDTFDMEVVKNVLDDLPISVAFEPGKTELIEGVRMAAEIARPWQPDSTTLVIVSDGDTMPDSGMPQLPRSISQVMVVGVGDARTGLYIDGHQSRQDASTLRQLAGRLRGDYFDANAKHLPSKSLATLAESLPLRDTTEKGRRELALVAVSVGGFFLAGLPVALALAGSPWQSARQSGLRNKTTRRSRGEVSAGDAQNEGTQYA